MPFVKEEEEVGQIVSLGDLCIKHVLASKNVEKVP